ncbi:alpha/beta-hydrolase [Ascobolus immersus RN42]|uniref:Alpha/beta-hydrolase n=1 Tax=Ascobolus immersus RN42 TaxID=1160509 RepID=A0A3N4IHN3_ASCIM|nr:alpha/beta-hydrolase [Ascobolus immersus RN42]
MEALQQAIETILHHPQRNTLFATAGALTALGTALFLNPLKAPPTDVHDGITSGRTQLSKLSDEEYSRLPYPPDIYPGGEWLDTPYGTIRTYEFGPKNGKKVLFVHGISTPSIVARDLIWDLVEKGGCRVLIFDLFGRGWSDTPYLPHDSRLYTSQILLVTRAAKADFSRFSIIGYSLGGGIAMSFASYFPKMIEDITLLAPAGLLRSTRIGLFTRLAYVGMLPGGIEELLVRARVWFRASGANEGAESAKGSDGNAMPYDVRDRTKPIDIPAIMKWQTSTHQGFFYSFASSFRHSPIYDRDEEWIKVANYLKRGEIGGKKVLMVMGEVDTVVDLGTLEIAKKIMGEDRVKSVILKGVEHDLVAKNAPQVAEAILDFYFGEGRHRKYY